MRTCITTTLKLKSLNRQTFPHVSQYHGSGIWGKALLGDSFGCSTRITLADHTCPVSRCLIAESRTDCVVLHG